MFIEQPAKWLRWLYPKAIWRMDKKEHSVYLTFDDGPIPESTPIILEILRKYNVKATFFMVGENVLRHHDLYNQIVEEGHQVGNHTFNHIGAFKHRVISYVLNTNKANELIHAHLFRPPHGWMRPSEYWWLHRTYKVIMWDLVTREKICQKRQHYHLPRLTEKYRKTENSLASIHRMAKRTRL